MGYLFRNLMKLNVRLNQLNFCQTIKKIIFKQQKIENEKEFKNLLISSNILKRCIEDSNDNIKFYDIIIKDYNNEYDEFISEKKDYDLLYTPVFIKEIKKDLLDLEFNIALEKSISLF